MSRTVTIRLERPICSATLLEGTAEDLSAASAETDQAELLQRQKENLAQVCQALQDAVNKVNEFQKRLFKEHKEQIAKLSVEIARKILVRKVQQGDYEIESIVQESLKNAPTRQDVVVHLNPDDLAQCQEIREDVLQGTLAGVKLIGDPNVGRAECVLETPRGIVESFIDGHLARIAEALERVE
jgi:flagellar biosynthesis/type III secretory pathway protein FliH